jgi:hypothetical protein
MKTKKTEKQIAKSDAEKAAQAIALSKAIDAMAGAYAKVKNLIARLFDKSEKEAIYKIVSDYVKPGTDDDRKRAMQVCDGVKDQLNYEVMTESEQAALNSTLREFREKIGVKARKTKKRKPVKNLTDDKSASVILPEIGNTENEKLALVMQVMTALDSALGTTREETIALIIKAAEATETKVKKNKAA